MAKTLAELNVKIGGDINRFNKAMSKVERRMNKMSRNMSKIGDSITRSFGAPFIGMVGASIHLFDKQAQAIAQVDAGLKSTNGTVGFTSEKLQKMASDLQGITTYGDEDILSGVTSQLLTFTNVAGAQFEEAQVQALNLSTRLGVDLKSASIQLGKALNDPIKGISAMSRSGIQFSEDQKKMITTLTETGQAAKAQEIILKELESQFGGSAEAAAKAGLGPMLQLKNSIGDIGETIGELALPMVTEMANKLKVWVDKFAALDKSTKRNILNVGKWVTIIGGGLAIGGRLIGTIGTMTRVVSMLGTGVIKFKGIFQALNIVMKANPIGAVVTGISLLIGGLVLAYNKSAKFRSIIDGLAGVAVEFFNIMKESLGKFVGSFKAFGEGEWKEGIKLFGQGLVESNPIAIAFTQGDRLGKAYGDSAAASMAKSVQDGVEEAVKKIELPAAIVPAAIQQTSGGSSGSSSASGISDVASPERLKGIETLSKGMKMLATSYGDLNNLDLSSYYETAESISIQSKKVVDEVGSYILDISGMISQGLENMYNQLGETIGNIISGAAKSSSAIGLVVMPLIGVLDQIGKNTIKLGVTMAAAKKAIKFGNPYVAIAAGVAMVAAAAAFKSSVPKLAKGGIAKGETLAVVGDNPGASSGNPEVISPLNTLKSYIPTVKDLSASLNSQVNANLNRLKSHLNPSGGNMNMSGKLTAEGGMLAALIEIHNSESSRYSS